MMNFKHCLLAFVMLIAPPAWAGWELIAENQNGAQFFIDFESIRKDGNRMKAWQLTNFVKPLNVQGNDIRSFRTRYEFDCKQEQIRHLTTTAFLSLNAGGAVFKTDDTIGNWYDIAPKTVDWELLQSVCKAPAR
jgi:hypothetical protein